jgi:hypothetical protein
MTFRKKILQIHPEAFCEKEKCIDQLENSFYSFFIYLNKNDKYAFVGGSTALKAWKIAYRKMTTIEDMQNDKK